MKKSSENMKIPKTFLPEKDLEEKIAHLSIECEDDTNSLNVGKLDIEDFLLQKYSSSLISKGELTSTAIVTDYPYLNLDTIDRKVFACYRINREESMTIHILKLLCPSSSDPKLNSIAAENHTDKIRLCLERSNTFYFPVICHALAKGLYIMFIYSNDDRQIRTITDTYQKKFHLKKISA